MLPLLAANTGDLNLPLLAGMSGLWTFSRTSGATMMLAGSLIEVATGLPRFETASDGTPLGLLLEPQVTNGIRNPRAEGSSIGIPGTAPTFWQVRASAVGLSSQIVGSGTESGIPYVDARIFGTTTASGAWDVLTEQSGIITAIAGTTFSNLAYLRLVGGSMAGISLTLTMPCVGGTEVGGTVIVPTSAGLATQLYSQVQTSTTGTTSVQQRIRGGVGNGVTIDATLRIGAPNLQQTAAPTSVILPPAGSPAAATRAGDQLLIDVSRIPWFPGNGCTFGLEWTQSSNGNGGVPISYGGTGVFFDNTTYSTFDAGGNLGVVTRLGGAGSSSSAQAMKSLGQVNKLLIAVAPTGLRASLNGGTILTAAQTGIPPATRIAVGFGGWSNVPATYPLHARRATVAPRIMSDVELIAGTA
jgi:hypothetical protein